MLMINENEKQVNCKLSMKTYQLLKIIHELKIDPPIDIKKNQLK